MNGPQERWEQFCEAREIAEKKANAGGPTREEILEKLAKTRAERTPSVSSTEYIRSMGEEEALLWVLGDLSPYEIHILRTTVTDLTGRK